MTCMSNSNENFPFGLILVHEKGMDITLNKEINGPESHLAGVVSRLRRAHRYDD